VFVICACNNISKLPPEFARAERFDGVFFVGLPTAGPRAAIWDISLRLFALETDQQRPADENWTGAEIRSCCRLAALLDVPLKVAAQNVVPVAVTAAESFRRIPRPQPQQTPSPSSPYSRNASRRDTLTSIARRRPSVANQSP
jgi:SpoVK/Ycf46/Vps4 family AAA+-type ATPase